MQRNQMLKRAMCELEDMREGAQRTIEAVEHPSHMAHRTESEAVVYAISAAEQVSLLEGHISLIQATSVEGHGLLQRQLRAAWRGAAIVEENASGYYDEWQETVSNAADARRVTAEMGVSIEMKDRILRLAGNKLKEDKERRLLVNAQHERTEELKLQNHELVNLILYN